MDIRFMVPAMLLAAGIAVGPANAAAPAATITVVMVDNRFEPDHIVFRAGQAYKLRLENHGKEMHEFTAPAFLKAATIPDKRKLANGGTDIVVQPGTTVTIALVAPATGDYPLSCADHDWDGMVGSISVR